MSDLLAVGHYPITVNFSFCDGTNVQLDFQFNVNGNTITIEKPLRRALEKNIYRPDVPFSFEEFNLKQNEIVFPNQNVEELLKNKKSKTEIEGVYKLYTSTTTSSINKIAIIEKEGKFYIINLASSYFSDDWKYGEKRGELFQTASEKFMIGNILNVQKKEMEISLNNINKGLIEIENQISKEKLTFVKLM